MTHCARPSFGWFGTLDCLSRGGRCRLAPVINTKMEMASIYHLCTGWLVPFAQMPDGSASAPSPSRNASQVHTRITASMFGSRQELSETTWTAQISEFVLAIVDTKLAHVWLRCSAGKKGSQQNPDGGCSGPAGHFLTVTPITNKLKIFQLSTKILGVLVLIEDWPGSYIACQAGPAHATAPLGRPGPQRHASSVGLPLQAPHTFNPQIPRNRLACGLPTNSATPEAATLSIFAQTTRASSPEPADHWTSCAVHHFPRVKADLQAFPQFRLPRSRLFRSYHSDAQIAICTFSPPQTTGKINSHGTIRRLPAGCPVSARPLANRFRPTGQDLKACTPDFRGHMNR